MTARAWMPTIAMALLICVLNLDRKNPAIVPDIPITVSRAHPVLHVNYSHIPVDRQVPKLVIAGAQKGGTTAIAKILGLQEQFLPHAPRCRQSPELHYFDKRIYTPKSNKTLEKHNVTRREWDTFLEHPHADTLTDKMVDMLRESYAYCWNIERPQPEGFIAMEKTPIYMIQPGLASVIQRVAPWSKVLFVVREPVARAYSSWKMDHRRGFFTEPFEYYIDLEVNHLREMGLSNAPTLEEFSKPGFIVDPSRFQLSSSMMERREKRASDADLDMSMVYLYRSMYAELLTAWMEYFQLRKTLMVVSHETFLEDRLGVIHDIQSFVGANITNVSSDVLESNYQGGFVDSPLNATTREYLNLFFKPYNNELLRLLGQEWYLGNAGDKWSSQTS